MLFEQEADFRADQTKQEQELRLIVESPHVGTVLAARDDGAVVGMVSLLFAVSTAEGDPACWLEDMVVRPDRRGGGLGSRLLIAAIEYAQARGFVRVTLLTDRGNEGAKRFHARHGFTESEMVALRLHL